MLISGFDEHHGLGRSTQKSSHVQDLQLMEALTIPMSGLYLPERHEQYNTTQTLEMKANDRPLFK